MSFPLWYPSGHFIQRMSKAGFEHTEALAERDWTKRRERIVKATYGDCPFSTIDVEMVSVCASSLFDGVC